MCSLCGALGRGLSFEQCGALGESARWQLRREAVRAAARISALLGQRRIKVTAAPDVGFVVAFPTGGSERAAGLAEIWHVLARRGVPVPDPLGSA